MKQIAFASGKGGAGKTTLSAAFFDHVASMSVFADCDVDASDAFILLEKRTLSSEPFESGYKYEIEQDKCTSCGICREKCVFGAIKIENGKYLIDLFKCEGCGRCALACPAAAIKKEKNYCGDIFNAETHGGHPMAYARFFPAEDNSGKLASKVRMRAVAQMIKEKRSLIVIDSPPGTGCPLTASITGIDFLVVVIECTMSGFSDAQRLIELAEKMKIPVMAVLNKTGPDDLTLEKAKRMLAEKGIPLAGKIPFTKEVSSLINRKKLITDTADPALKTVIERIFAEICRLSGIEKRSEI